MTIIIMIVRTRAVVTLCLLALGIFQAISGVVLFLAPKGYRSGKAVLLGLEKSIWSDYHSYIGLILIAVVILHLTLNWRMFVNELKVLRRR
jgi:uncharacterized iron-regulated membrane protein